MWHLNLFSRTRVNNLKQLYAELSCLPYSFECIIFLQYDRENIEDVWDVYGTVSCKAELEGTMPEITLTISQVSEGEVTPLDHLLTHPCVQSADADILDEGKLAV